MTDKTIENHRMVGGDYFHLQKMTRSKFTLDHFLPLFNFEDYWCYKTTRHQRLVTYEDLLEFKYSCYIFFRKDLYNKEHIDLWIKCFRSIGGIKYLVKPLPPFTPDKIKIMK